MGLGPQWQYAYVLHQPFKNGATHHFQYWNSHVGMGLLLPSGCYSNDYTAVYYSNVYGATMTAYYSNVYGATMTAYYSNVYGATMRVYYSNVYGATMRVYYSNVYGATMRVYYSNVYGATNTLPVNCSNHNMGHAIWEWQHSSSAVCAQGNNNMHSVDQTNHEDEATLNFACFITATVWDQPPWVPETSVTAEKECGHKDAQPEHHNIHGHMVSSSQPSVA